MGTIGSAEGVSFGGVIREVAPGVREGVSTSFALVAGVMTPGVALPNDGGPVAGARGVLVPETTGGFVTVPKIGPGATLESSAAGTSVPTSGLGIRLNAPGLIPARLGVVVVAGLVASPAVGFKSAFGPEPPSEKPVQPDPRVGGVAAGPVTREGVGVLLRGVPFAVSSGGVCGFGIKEGGTALMVRSTDDSNSVRDGVGEGAFALPSHFPNGVFGDAGRGLSRAGFSPFTSSSLPPDTGTFASGELRSGRVLGLPRLLLVELGEGEDDWSGDGSVGVGC